VAALVLTAAGFGLAACDRDGADARPDTPSGQPVPRWVSLRSGQVNGRAGPGPDYPVVWQYTVRGLPVQVLGETREWRRVCDPDGAVAWIAATRTAGRRTAMRVKPGELPLRAAPKAEARVTARLAARAVADVDRCEDGWCRLSVGDVRGWAPEGEVFGTQTARQCQGAPVGRRPQGG
jgi:SH3-like domain-containing protein